MAQYGINSKHQIRGVTLTYIDISRICQPLASELQPSRLAMLENGFNRLDEILADPNWPGNVNESIALEPNGGMYSVTNGRHRVFLVDAD